MKKFNLHNQTFGVEIEFSGIWRMTARDIVAKEVNAITTSGFEIIAPDYRSWQIVRDGSVNNIDGGDANELVTPPLTTKDIPLLMNIVNKLREAGAKVDDSCGIHIHVGIQDHNVLSLKNLVKYYAKYESLFYNSCQVLQRRLNHFTMPLKERHYYLVQEIDKVKKLDDLKALWYAGYGYRPETEKYNYSRYCGLNLHNIWFKGWHKGTVEFRFFNSTLKTDNILAYITLALSINAKALNNQPLSKRNIEDISFTQFLAGLGIKSGDKETSVAYKVLTKVMKRA